MPLFEPGLGPPFGEVEKILNGHGVEVQILDHLIAARNGNDTSTMRLFRDGVEVPIQFFTPDSRVEDHILKGWAASFGIDPGDFGIPRITQFPSGWR